MKNLLLWQEYTRKDVHSIFSPETTFTPQRGTWGLQGMVRVPSRPGDWVFFVTFGQAQGDHIFDESITNEGVLSWQSQPAQRLEDEIIQELIHHDDRINSIHLFLRTKKGNPYGYFGRLGYLTHDTSREKPVHFQWQLLDWNPPSEFLNRINLNPVVASSDLLEKKSTSPFYSLTVTESPQPRELSQRKGVDRDVFQNNKTPDYATRDVRNRDLGLRGELLVLRTEKERLVQLGRADLAEKVTHVSQVEGDSAGYDIRSYEADGTLRHIEVKTTRGPATTSFFISPNEISFSSKNPNSYILFRLYEFNDVSESAKTYLLKGNVALQLRLEPTAFRAQLN